MLLRAGSKYRSIQSSVLALVSPASSMCPTIQPEQAPPSPPAQDGPSHRPSACPPRPPIALPCQLFVPDAEDDLYSPIAASVLSPAAAAGSPSRSKSAKRKAAEAVLKARYSPIIDAVGFAAAPVAMPRAVGAAAAVAAGPAAIAQRVLLAITSGVPSKRKAQHLDLPQAAAKRFCTSAAAAGSAAASTPSTSGAEEAVFSAAPAGSSSTPSTSAAAGNNVAAAGAAAPAAMAGPGSSRSKSSSSSGTFVHVAACPPTCFHPHAPDWCHFQVQVPHVDWHALTSGSPAAVSGFRIADGYEQFTLPGGLQVLLVENAAYVGAAMQVLRASMTDPVIAIDLEWRPEFSNKNFTPVALVQLASSRVAVLIRVCRMGFQLPQPVRAVLQDPAVCLLGCGWAGADEAKMQKTFGVGAQQFGGVLDVQLIAKGLGYHRIGLANLSKAVLGVHVSKNKKVSMSNWETRVLTRLQVHYAALDVLLAGQVFRGLRLWHTCQEPCETCHQLLGAVLLGPPAPRLTGAAKAAATAAAAAPAAAGEPGKPAAGAGSNGAPERCPACERVLVQSQVQQGRAVEQAGQQGQAQGTNAAVAGQAGSGVLSDAMQARLGR